MRKIVTAMSLCFAMTVIAKEEKPVLSWSATEVSKGLYMLSGEGGFTGGNLGLSIGDDGVILIDDAMPSTLEIMNKAISDITKKPIDFLINTHVHGDHTGNNTSLGANGARIVAHENLRESFLTKGVQGPEGMIEAPKSSLPVITFGKSMDFHLNGNSAHLFHMPHAHTDGDTLIHFKEANVIHMGDVFFNGMFPYIDYDNGGNLDGYIKAQQKVISMADYKTKIIPGHGPLASKSDLQKANQMLLEVKDIIHKLVDEGHSEEEVVKMNPLKDYHESWNWGFITTERMVRQTYKGLTTKTHSH